MSTSSSRAPKAPVLAAGRVIALTLGLIAGAIVAWPPDAAAAGLVPTVDAGASALGAASWCSATTALPTSTRPGTLVVADNFESGSLTTRWLKTDQGDAWAGVTASWSHSGRCAGRLIVTSSSTSRANVRRGLPSGTREVWASGWFRVNKQGARGSNVPTFRLFNGTARILDVHRQNISGALWLRTASGTGSWRYVKLNRTLSLNRWYKVEIHVRTAWHSSIVSVWLSGTLLYRSTSYYLPTSRLTTVMIGAEHVRQVMDLGFDDVVVKAL